MKEVLQQVYYNKRLHGCHASGLKNNDNMHARVQKGGEAGKQHDRVLVYGRNYMKVETSSATLSFCCAKTGKAKSRH